MPETGTSGSMSGDGRRSGVLAATAFILDSTHGSGRAGLNSRGKTRLACHSKESAILIGGRRGISHCVENTQSEIPLPQGGIGMTAWKGFPAPCEVPPFRQPTKSVRTW